MAEKFDSIQCSFERKTLGDDIWSSISHALEIIYHDTPRGNFGYDMEVMINNSGRTSTA